MGGKWYQKTWVWLCAISSLIFIGLILFAIYLLRLEYITLFDIRFLFTNDTGNYDWGIFWSFAGAFGTIFVALLALRLINKLGKIQMQQYDLEAMPFVMLGSISLKRTNVDAKNERFIGLVFAGVTQEDIKGSFET